MSVNVYDPVNDTLTPVAGATLFAEMPLGSIIAFAGKEINLPEGYLAFNGQTVKRNDYPDLWAFAVANEQVGVDKFFSQGDGSTTFTLADLRETSLKGYGETSRTVGAHVKSGGLGIGEFIDDQLQDHEHEGKTTEGTGGANVSKIIGTSGSPYSGSGEVFNARTGTTTEVKAVGVVWAVKAKQTGLPIDLKAEVEKIATKFPDYAHPISIPDGTLTWTATEDCYIQTLYTTTDTSIGVNSRVVTIDGQLVGTSDATSTVATRQFSGYVKKGQVVSSYDQTLNLGFMQYVRVFPLSS